MEHSGTDHAEARAPTARSADSYLQYVRFLRDRIASDIIQDGIKKWMLVAALTLVVFKALPDISNLSLETINGQALWLTFAYVHALLTGAALVAAGLLGPTSRTRFDYRFTVADSIRSNWQLFFTVAPILLWATVTTGICVYRDFTTTALETAVFVCAASVFGVLFLIMLLVATWGLTNWKKDPATGESYPTSGALSNLPTTKGDKFYGIFGAILLASAIYHLLIPNVRPTPVIYESYLTLSFIISLALLTALLFTKSMPDVERLKTLERLERDIVLHDISPREIKTRLQTHYLGHELQGWLEEHMNSITEDAAAVSLLTTKETTFFEDLSGLGPELRHERAGRIRTYLNDLNQALDRFGARRTKLVSCLTALKLNQKEEHFVSSTIDSFIERITHLDRTEVSGASNLIGKLRKDDSLSA